jgi:hypothetical protein
MEQPEAGLFWTAMPTPATRPGTAPAWYPGAQRPMQPGTPAPGMLFSPQLMTQMVQMLRTIEMSLPAEQVIHSLHHQAMKDPAIRELAPMKRLSEASLNHLHAMMTTAGNIRRMLSGDLTRPVMLGLQEQLKAADKSYQVARSALTEVLAAEPAKAVEPLQILGQVFGMKEQALRAMTPAVRTVLAIELPTT